MTVLTCGISHTDPRSEAIYRALREDAGQRTDGGCGRALDLTNHIQQAITYRCVECGRWLCRPCILRHFAETGDDQRAASSAEPSTVTTRTITIRCHCGRGVTIGPDPWCEGCVQSAATCDCVPATQGRGDA